MKENNVEEEKEQEPIAQNWLRDTYIHLLSGTAAGAAVAVALNPWDRALYLSIKHHRPFLRWNNFKNPYEGFIQAGMQRVVNGGFYFMIQGQLRDDFVPKIQNLLGLDETTTQLTVGLGAGIINGFCNSPSTLIKYKRWGVPNATFSGTAKNQPQHYNA